MWYNPLMTLILKSPLHRLLSKNILLLTYTGRKSGKTYRVPVNYVRTGNGLLVVTFRRRGWWHNLKGGAPVIVLLEGQRCRARAEAIYASPAEIQETLLAYLAPLGALARHMGVERDEDGSFTPASLAKAAEPRVMVRICLETQA